MLLLLPSLAFAAAPSPVDLSAGALLLQFGPAGSVAVVAHPSRLVALEARADTGVSVHDFPYGGDIFAWDFISTTSLSARLSYVPGPDPNPLAPDAATADAP